MSIGSTFISESKPSRLASLSNFDDLEEFQTVELDLMTTLDFQMLVGDGGKKWTDGEPLLFDPGGGVAVFKVNPAGLKYVLGKAKGLEKEQAADIRKLAEFVRKHGSETIYEVATF